MATGLREHLVAFFEERHKLVEAGALRLLLDDGQPLVLSQEVVARAGTHAAFVTEAMVAEVIAERLPPAGGVALVATPSARTDGAARAGFEPIVEGFSGTAPAGPPLVGYEALFHSRFRTLQRFLRGRPTLPNQRAVRDLRPVDGGASVVGMVREVRETSKRHHRIVTLDDESGSVEVLVPQDTPGATVPFVSDEVIGVALRFGRDAGRLPLAVAVERPDVPASRAVGRAARPRRAIFLSDLHVGSRAFLADRWAELVDFLRGQGPHAELAHSIDHVVIAGDLVDGIGVYPNQERDLAIQDIVEQYAELGRRLGELPDRLTIVVVPGNHDAVCPAEPQPALPASLARALPANVRCRSNPSTFALDGVTVSAYHGRGFDDLIPAIPGASYARPTEVMRRMLQMRHLAPIYGDRTPLAPGTRDGLVLEPLPDILVTGHLHTYAVDRYRGVLLLNASAWQGETAYQRMRNIVPMPARAAVVDLASLAVVSLDFSGDEPTAVGPAS